MTAREPPPLPPAEAEAILRSSGLAPAGFQRLEPVPNQRRNPRARQSFVVHGPGPLGFLTLGSDLAALEAGARSFAVAYPDLAVRTLGFARVQEHDLLLQEHFPGRPLLEAFAHDATRAADTLAKVADRLAAGLRPSTPDAARAELDAFLRDLAGLPLWQPSDLTVLQEILGPFLREELLRTPPSCRISNADFISRNILCTPEGDVRIIDYEHTCLTHFHGEDWVRFSHWEELPPAVAAFVNTRIANRPAWTVYLALRQLVLESRIHSQRRLHLDALRWCAVIKSVLSDAGGRPALPGDWPSFARDVGCVGVQLFWETPAGWSEASSQVQTVAPGFHELTFLIPPTPVSQLRLDPLDIPGRALVHRIQVREIPTDTIVFQADGPESLAALLPAGDAKILPATPGGNALGLSAEGNDPQLFLPPMSPVRTVALEVVAALEVYPAESPPIESRPGPPCPLLQGNVEQITADAIIGWAHDPQRPQDTVQVDICIEGRKAATVDAAAFRSDLRAAGLGDGRKAFYFNPRPFLGEHEATVTVTFGRTAELLPNGRQRVQPTVPPAVDWDPPAMRTPAASSRLQRHPNEDWPLISVIIPVYNTPEPYLEHCVASVVSQSYPHWELLLVDDGSTAADLPVRLARLTASDERIRLVSLPRNQGISRATNAGLQAAKGSYVALLDHDDALTPDALAEVALVVLADPTIDVVYSDQDKIDGSNRRFQPFHKPAWSPIYLLGVMYVGHLLVVRTELLRKTGGCDPAFDRVQDFELMLRLSEATNRIVHVPEILYHWRTLPGSIALSSHAKGPVDELQCAAVQGHLARRGIAARASSHPAWPHRVRLLPAADADPRLVSVIIPTKDAPEHIARCLDSLFTRTTHRALEVIVVDNGTTDPAARETLARHPVQLVPNPGPFNFSAAINLGAGRARGEVLVLLNNDTEVLTPGWIEILLTHLDLPEVGAVGPLLLYPDGTVQHAGVALGLRGTCDHVLRGADPDTDGYAGSLACAREVSALTAACLMVRRRHFQQLGGLETGYARIYQDTDFCLRLGESGLHSVFVPGARLVHHESVSRGSGYDFVDRALFLDRWGQHLRRGDPYYNRNFTRNRPDYAVRTPCT